MSKDHEKNKATEISLLSKRFELRYLSKVTHLNSYPYLIVDGKPIASVEHIDNNPTDDGLLRAVVALRSFEGSGGKLCEQPGPSNESSDVEFSLELIADWNVSIDLYNQFGVPHYIVEAEISGEHWFRFAIFDRAMCEDIYNIKPHRGSIDCFESEFR